ncbi:MAG: hypothetical protein QW318_07495 [Candidatus Caldarchaeum sp.]
MTPEGRIKRAVKALFKKYEVYHFSPATGGYGTSGIPDFVGCLEGKFFGVECKADRTKSLTKLQELQGKLIVLAGGQFFVVCDQPSLSALEAWIKQERCGGACEIG